MSTDSDSIRTAVHSESDRHLRRLRDGCRVSFGGLDSFQEWVAEQLQSLGGTVSEFEVDEEALHDQPAMRATLADDPDALRTGTNVVGEIFEEQSHNLLLYAHADTEPVTQEYISAGHGVEETDDRVAAPGIADDVSGLLAILSALEVVHERNLDPEHSVSVASILGKQCGVAGTYGLVRQHEPTDGAVYVHPAESGTGLSEIKVGSNGVLEFGIEIQGSEPETTELHHTLFAEADDNPISVAGRLGNRLQNWVETLEEQYHHDAVSELAGRSTGLLLGDIEVTEAPVYQVPEACRLRGTVSFPPTASLTEVRPAFEETVRDFIADESELAPDRVTVQWGDIVGDSAETDLDSPIAETTASVLQSVTGRRPSWYYGHTISDIRYPMQYWETETLGFGPRAGAMGEPTEWVEKSEYLDTVAALVRLLTTAMD